MKALIFILLVLPFSLFAQKSGSTTKSKPKQSTTTQTPATLKHELILLNSKKEKSNAELVKIKVKYDASTKKMTEVRDKATVSAKKLDSMTVAKSSNKKEKDKLEEQFNQQLVQLDKLVGE